MFRTNVLLVMQVLCLHHVRSACLGVEECPSEQPYCSISGCVSTCGDLYIDPDLQCVPYCEEGLEEITDTITTASGDEYLQKRCVSICPEHKRYRYNGVCVNQCPADKPYYGREPLSFGDLGHFFDVLPHVNASDIFDHTYPYACVEACALFVVNMSCGDCPNNTKYIDDNKHCLNSNDCPPGTMFRDNVTYKGYGITQCLHACDELMVFWKDTCTYYRNCKHPWFIFDGQCILECPGDYVTINRITNSYFLDFTCARKWVLCVAGSILLVLTAILIVYWRHDFHGVCSRYLLIWKIRVRGIDILVSTMATVDYHSLQSAPDVIELDDIGHVMQSAPDMIELDDISHVTLDEHVDGYDNQISGV